MKRIKSLLMVIVFGLCSWAAFAQSVDINTATVEELQALQGIGPKKAAAIVEYRKLHGPFKSVDDLAQVPGIGGKTLEGVKGNLTAGPAPAGAAPHSMMPDTKGVMDKTTGEKGSGTKPSSAPKQ